MSGRRRGNSSAKALQQMEDMCKSGDPATAYEALQMYRSRANRHIHKGDKGDRNEYAQALSVSTSGAVNLAENGYDSAALELALHISDLLEKMDASMDATTKANIVKIDDAFADNSKSRGSFLKQVIKWDRVNGERALGEPELHVRLGFNLWENDETRIQATHHFALGEAPDQLASKLMQVEKTLVRDRLLVMGVLHFLSAENLRDATKLVALHKRNTKGKGDSSKLMRFSDQLVRLCCRDAAPLFQKLCTTCAKELAFDESVPQLIKGPIASIYFNIKPERSINPMLQALLGGLHG